MKKALTRGLIIVMACSMGIMLTGCSGKYEEIQSADEAVNSITAGWNLGNSLDPKGDWITGGLPSSHETAWGNPVTKPEMITAVKEVGFNAIRVPVTWTDHMDDEGNVDEAWMNRVQEVVDYVVSQDMYCIINVHHDGGPDGWIAASTANYEKNKDKYKHLWTQIADRFKDYDGKLLFEAANEVLDENGNWWTDKEDAFKGLNLYQQLFVDTVRSCGGYNKTRNLIVMTYAGAHDTVMYDNLAIPSDTVENHLIMEIHNYDPMEFNWTEVSWAQVRDTWGTDADYEQVKTSMETLASYSEKYGVPAIIGEFGSNFKDNDEERIKFVTSFVGTAAEHGIKCFWWDTSGMGLLDRYRAEMKYPEVAEAIVAAAEVSE